MNEDRSNVLARAVDALVRLDEHQEALENVAFDILNCTDLIRSAVNKTQTALRAAEESFLDRDEESKQAILHLKDCLDELSTFSESVSMCAHSNEETFEQQHESIEEIKQIMDYMSSYLN